MHVEGERVGRSRKRNGDRSEDLAAVPNGYTPLGNIHARRSTRAAKQAWT